MPGPIGRPRKAADGNKKDDKALISKRGRREDERLQELAKVQLMAEAPEKPKNLDAVASQHWDELVSMLVPLRLMTPLDGASLAHMCRAHSIIERAMKEVDRCMVKKVSGGGERINGNLKIAKDWQQVYDRYADKFGMTPQARAKMRIPLPKLKDNGAKKETNRSRMFGPGA